MEIRTTSAWPGTSRRKEMGTRKVLIPIRDGNVPRSARNIINNVPGVGGCVNGERTKLVISTCIPYKVFMNCTLEL